MVRWRRLKGHDSGVRVFMLLLLTALGLIAVAELGRATTNALGLDVGAAAQYLADLPILLSLAGVLVVGLSVSICLAAWLPRGLSLWMRSQQLRGRARPRRRVRFGLASTNVFLVACTPVVAGATLLTVAGLLASDTPPTLTFWFIVGVVAILLAGIVATSLVAGTSLARWLVRTVVRYGWETAGFVGRHPWSLAVTRTLRLRDPAPPGHVRSR